MKPLPNSLRYLVIAALLVAALAHERVCSHLRNGALANRAAAFAPGQPGRATASRLSTPAAQPQSSDGAAAPATEGFADEAFVNDSLYDWDAEAYDWYATGELYCAEDEMIDAAAAAAPEPKRLEWPLLLDLKFRPKWDAELEMPLYAPIFNKQVRALEGAEVTIEGYLIPFDETGAEIAVSANPFASCFFFGKASPASVISVRLRRPSTAYEVDDVRTVRGKLHLNRDDPDEFYYGLRDAVVE